MLSTTLSGNYGFPLCISGISHLSLSKEMVDHEKRRKEMKRSSRSEGNNEGRRSHGEEEEEMGVERIDEQLWWLQEMRENGEFRDLVALLEDLGSFSFYSHAAKAV